MTNVKRQRGRPRGSGKDDTPYLIRIADLLVCNPSMKPATAMKRLIKERKAWDATDTTLLRRWQVKWKANGVELLAAAHERAQQRPPIVSTHLTAFSLMQALKAVENLSPCLKTMREIGNSPFIKAMREIENSPAMQAIKKWNDLSVIQASPWLNSMREMGSSSFVMAVREIENSSAMRAIKNWNDLSAMQTLPSLNTMREMGSSSFIRAMREIENSPAMQAIRDMKHGGVAP